MSKMICFQSFLAEQMQQFVAFKRMQGYDYTNQARTLSYFDSFLSRECGGVQASCLGLDVLQDYVATTALVKERLGGVKAA